MFGIIKGLPYLIHKGMAIPVKIEHNGDYSYNAAKGKKTDVKGIYTAKEVLAKCEILSSLEEKKPKEPKSEE